MATIAITSLPEELLLRIFDSLGALPPSERKIRQEPSFDMVKCLEQPLKKVSLTCKRWRRIVLPLLFRDACVRLDVTWRDEWRRCKACDNVWGDPLTTDDPELRGIDNYHIEMIRAFQNRCRERGGSGSNKIPSATMSTSIESFEYPDETETAYWAWRIHHATKDFCSFIQSCDLGPSIRSVAVLSRRMLAGKLGRFPHQTGTIEWRYSAAAAFWSTLFNVMCPDRIVIMMPPTELACLANASIDTYGDWAFADMDYHILEIRCESNSRRPPQREVDYSKLWAYPPGHPRIAPASVLFTRDWTQLTLNEGSFLKAYATYEFFERGPPSVVYSIQQSLTPSPSQRRPIERGICDISQLRSFRYIAIFPFSNHANFSDWLPHLEEIDLQFAPDPHSGILDDKSRVGKAELQDCWTELFGAYQAVAGRLATSRMPEERYRKLKKVICRDFQNLMLVEDLDEIFLSLCLPSWIESPPGTYLNRTASESSI